MADCWPPSAALGYRAPHPCAPGRSPPSFSSLTSPSGETITSCYLDAVQANVNFDASGAIVNELSADVASKNTLGDDYGMHAYSSIGADWHTQAASFSSYVTGKTVAEAAGIAVAEGKATDADLSSSVTMGIGDFLELIAKAG